MGITDATSDAKKRSVEKQPSETAMGVAAARAFAAVDEREEIRGSDYLAEIFLADGNNAEDHKRSLKD